MGFPAQLDPDETNYPSEDSVSHFFAREVQLLLRVVVCLSIIATAATAITFWFWAWIPAVGLLVSFLLLIISNAAERRTGEQARAHLAARLHEEAIHEHSRDTEAAATPIPAGVRTRESVIGWEIIIGCSVGAIILTSALLPADLLLLGTAFVFLFALFVMAPVWLGWITEETDREDASLRDHTSTTPRL